jgi:predicted nucleotidyltransferase
MELGQIKKILVNEFRCKKNVIAVLLYGSYAKGTAKANSDVDIAILYAVDGLPDIMELWDLKTSISEKLRVEVDLICLNKADPIIGKQIYQYHLPIVVNNAVGLAEYFARLCSEYAELKEFIRPMEQQILTRKYYVRPRSHHEKNK